MNTREFINDEKSHTKYKEIFDKYKVGTLGVFSRSVVEKIQKISNGKSQTAKDIIGLKVMYGELNKIDFFDKLIDRHNYIYKIFETSEMENPLVTKKDILESQYTQSNKDKPVEILAKKAQLENRFSKLCKYGRNRLISKLAKKGQEQKMGRLFINTIYKNILIQGKMDEFLDNCHKFYVTKEIAKEEFEKFETTKMCEELIKQTKEEKINVKNAYLFSTFEYTQNYLLKNKAKDITKILDIYMEEKKKGEPSFDIETRNDPRVLGENDTGISVNIPNYVSPFKLHCSKELISDAEEKNEVKLLKQNIENPLEATIPHKVTDEQINKIKELIKYKEIFFKDRKRMSMDTKIFLNQKRVDISKYLTNNLEIKNKYMRREIRGKVTEIKEKEAELEQSKKETKGMKTKAKELKKEIDSIKENKEEKLERN